MDVSVPNSLSGFIDQRVRAGGYSSADAFVAELVRTEAGAMESIARGEALPIDGHFDRRLETLLDEAATSGDYAEATHRDFDEMEREGCSITQQGIDGAKPARSKDKIDADQLRKQQL
jgi:Arc/MetJ-type ribon-helix-helix transcriptional regulator